MKNKKWLFVFLALIVLVFTACQSKTEEKQETETENEQDVKAESNTESDESNSLEGSVVIDGSGTVYPLMAKLAENYMTNEHENVSVEVSRAGTSAGFEKFLTEGGTDFNDASRQIKDEEAGKADELGIEVKELKVALDGLTFVINKENDWAKEMTEEEIKKIFLADGNITKWSDINSD